MRVLTILQSTALRESNRVDLALTRGVFLFVACLVVMPAFWLERRFAAIGPLVFREMLGVSLCLMVFLAVRLGGDSVGDVRSGLLDLLFLSGTKPRQWLVVRIVQMWVAFASVWIIRAPLMFIIFFLGGIRSETVLATELLLLIGFFFLSSIGLLASLNAKSRPQVSRSVLVSIVVCEILLITPTFAISLLTGFYNWPIPAPVLHASDVMAQIGFISYWRSPITRQMDLGNIWPTCALYAGLAVAALATFWHRLSVVSSGAGDRSSAGSPEAARRTGRRERASRRCWDDALAWQAYCIHGSGKPLVTAKCVAYVLLGLGMWLLAQRGYHEAAFTLAAVAGAVAIFIAVNKTNDCLTREIREQTMPMLLLTPHEPDDFFAGWQRGAWRLAWPDVLFGAGVVLASYTLDPAAPAIAISIAAAILSSGPFMTLSPLVPFSFSGIATGLGLILIGIVMAGICVWVAVTVHPAALPLAAIPLAWLYNQILRRQVLPYWMMRKISSIV